MAILGWLLSKLGSGFVTALVGQFAAMYAKSKDDKLAGLQAVVGANTTDDANFLKATVENNRIKEMASHSWVTMTVVGVTAIPIACHFALICIDSMIPWCGHYGCFGTVPLPGHYEDDAKAILETFFYTAPFLPLATGFAAAAQKMAGKL